MKRILTAGLVAVGVIAASTAAYSGGHAKFEKQIKARKAVMTLYSYHIGSLAAMVKGEMEYNAETATMLANDMLKAASIQGGTMWPQGTDTETLGKPQGSDAHLDKPTFPSIIGLQAARDKAQELHHQALAALGDFPPKADILRTISQWFVERSH